MAKQSSPGSGRRALSQQDKRAIKKRLKQWQEDQGLSVAQLAEIAGADPKVANRWFKQEPTTPDLPQLMALARDRGLNLFWLFTGKESSGISARNVLVSALKAAEPMASDTLIAKVLPNDADPVALLAGWARQRIQEEIAARAREYLPVAMYAFPSATNNTREHWRFYADKLRATVERAYGIEEPPAITQSRERTMSTREVGRRRQQKQQGRAAIRKQLAAD